MRRTAALALLPALALGLTACHVAPDSRPVVAYQNMISACQSQYDSDVGDNGITPQIAEVHYNDCVKTAEAVLHANLPR